MSSHLDKRLSALSGQSDSAPLRDIRRGIEKESLRITPEGRLAQGPHPEALGSALSNPFITTDYSEALLEFITPVSSSIEESIATLEDIHRFTYSGIDGELLWAASMPCVLEGDAQIPVAQYGSSNIARMKTVYRYGLGHRYGRLMQTIAGIHYNFSAPDAFWDVAASDTPAGTSMADLQTERYLGLIRNFQRHSWLLIYLFGASPAVCRSFLRGREDHTLQSFDERSRSLYLPHATALRMGDLGYQSNAQRNLEVCYNDLEGYIEALHGAITRSHPAYEKIGVGEGDQHTRQLNTSLLQIENEFYSPVRPKRVTRSGEIPLGALKRGGIEYVEVRCIDVNPFLPVGIDTEQAYFLDTFLLYCLLEESPPCDAAQRGWMAENMQRVVNRGREPGLSLLDGGEEKHMLAIAGALMEEMATVAQALDEANGCNDHARSLKVQNGKLLEPALTPSAQILDRMQQEEIPFFRLAMNQSEKWAAQFRAERLGPEKHREFEEAAAASRSAQAAVEASDDVSFETFLGRYYSQYDALDRS